jgi:hypothetical protein
MSGMAWRIVARSESNRQLTTRAEVQEALERELRAQLDELSPADRRRVAKAVRRQRTDGPQRLEVSRRVERSEKREPSPREREEAALTKRLADKRAEVPADLRLSGMLARDRGGQTAAMLGDAGGDVRRLRDESELNTGGGRASFESLATAPATLPNGTREVCR